MPVWVRRLEPRVALATGAAGIVMHVGAHRASRGVRVHTVTIGGNDAGFADVIRACVLGGRDCGRGNLAHDYDEIPTRLTALLTELKRVAPNAAVFVLGYPHITPEPVGANRQRIEACGRHGQPLQASSVNCGVLPALAHFILGGNVADTAISFQEAAFLWETATDLNGKLRTAAADAGVHFVDVAAGMPGAGSSLGSSSHSPCSSEPWLNGFIAYEGWRRHVDMPIASGSFHPNEAGHRAYARLLGSYIDSQASAGVSLSESGLPVNPGVGR